MADAGALDRRIQFQRAALVDDGFQSTEVFSDHGAPVWAGKTDISDGERATAGWIEATVASRFVVRSSAFTRGLTAKDRIACGGKIFDIQGIKEIGRLDRLEITAVARADT